MDLELRKTNRQEQRPANRRLAQWRVMWLIEHFTSLQHFWCIDSFCSEIRHCAKRPNVNYRFSAHSSGTARIKRNGSFMGAIEAVPTENNFGIALNTNNYKIAYT